MAAIRRYPVGRMGLIGLYAFWACAARHGVFAPAQSDIWILALIKGHVTVRVNISQETSWKQAGVGDMHAAFAGSLHPPLERLS